ncbi:MAG: hypothetical protein ACYSUX_05455 [Planctomycetota bacterium]
MKNLTFSIIISVLVILFAGCSVPCFYQAGKSIDQCEQDLLECAYSDRPTSLCMQDKGYKYLDANMLPPSRKRKIVVLFQDSAVSGGRRAMPEEYWIAEGRDKSADNFKIVFEPGTQPTDPDASAKELIGYRIRRDDLGIFTKTPIYGDKQESTVSGGRKAMPEGLDKSTENFKVVFEPGTQATDPGAPAKELIGYHIRQDDWGIFTKAPIYGDKQESAGSAGRKAMPEGRDKSTENFKVVFEPGTQPADPDAPAKELIGYRLRQDDWGMFTKTPIYGDEQKGAGSAGRKAMPKGRDKSTENFKLVFEPGTQPTDPDAPAKELIGYRLRQDDWGIFTKTPIYEDE